MSVSFCSGLNVNMKNNDWLRLLLSLMTGADPDLRLGGGKCSICCVGNVTVGCGEGAPILEMGQSPGQGVKVTKSN